MQLRFRPVMDFGAYSVKSDFSTSSKNGFSPVTARDGVDPDVSQSPTQSLPEQRPGGGVVSRRHVTMPRASLARPIFSSSTSMVDEPASCPFYGLPSKVGVLPFLR